MSGIGTGYDLSISTYSPDGRIFQTEYAAKAVASRGTVMGLRCKDGVVLGVEKTIMSKMLEKGADRRTYPVARYAGMAIAGVTADGRQVINRAQEEVANYENVYGDNIPGHVLNDRIASYMHLFNLYWYARPFGTCALLAVWDDLDGPQLYMTEPSGNTLRYFGIAVGKNRQAAKTEIEKLDLENMTCRQGIDEVARIMHSIREEEKPFELEMAWICEETNRMFKQVPENLVQEAEAKVKPANDGTNM